MFLLGIMVLVKDSEGKYTSNGPVRQKDNADKEQ